MHPPLQALGTSCIALLHRLLLTVVLLGCAPAGEGLELLWQRPLGEGYAGLALDDGILYTLYRRGDDEVTVAIDAATGETRWESAYPASPVEGLKLEYGPGPHSTPLPVGERVFTTGINALLHAFDRHSGRVLWSRDLWREFPGATLLDRGYSCTPVAYDDLVVVVVGGPGQAVAAFDQASGELVWKAQDFAASPSSPILIEVDGQDQLVVFMADTVAGLGPADGRLLWSHPHRTRWGLNISRPIWGEDHTLFVSSAYDGGSRALRLERRGGVTRVRELWFQNRMRLHFTTAVRSGELVYGSNGDSGAIPLAAINMADGEIVWRSRDLGRANLVLSVAMNDTGADDGGADDGGANHVFALDEDCEMVEARVSAEGLEVLSQQRLPLSPRCWTAPLLADGKIFVRDRKTLAALVLKQSLTAISRSRHPAG